MSAASAAGAPRAFWPLQIGGWLAFVVALLLPWAGAFPLRLMLLNKLPLALSGFAVTLLLRGVYRRTLTRGANLWLVGAVAVLASLVGAVLWAGAARWAVRSLGVGALERGGVIGASIARVDDRIYLLLVLGTWSLLYLVIAHHQALQRERERSLRTEAQLHSAQLAALRYQLNPHFLFNALNAVSTLVLEKRAEEAGQMLSRLSGFLRRTLDGPDADEVALEDELASARQYLEIEGVRFGDRLSVRVAVEAAARRACVPSFILQPLLENAVRHAVAQRARGGQVTIDASCRGRMLVLSVSDDGPGLAAGSADGIGLTNTRARLRALYGDAQQLEMQSPQGGGLRVLLELPLRLDRSAAEARP